MAEKDLGYRRVQCTGRGSFIISLPKEWVQNIGLKRGSEIAFVVQRDSSLLLIPRKLKEGTNKDESSKLREYCISVDPKKDSESLYRMVRALYAIGADVIRVRFKSTEAAEKQKAELKNLVRDTFLGSEIIDESPDEITFQILIRHSEFPIEKAVRRMTIVALSANKDAILALKNLSSTTFQSVVSAHNDVGRLALYVVRQLKWGIERNLFRELGFNTPKEFLLYRIAVNNITDISDDALNIVSSLQKFKKMIEDQSLFLKETVDEEIYSQLLKFNATVHQFFEEAIHAMFKSDYHDAEQIITRRKSLSTLESELITLMSSKKLDPNIAAILRLMLDSSRRILDYGENMAELTLNRTVEDICTNYLVK
ncbi:MAG: AbrB/MazE/SpoVT family DNA-binding domain-containing protein [Candidatus Bathyarchaeia archaeon]